MSSIEEVRAGIAGACELATEALSAVVHGLAKLEEALGALTHATEGSGQADVTEARGLWAQAAEGLRTEGQGISAGISAAEGVANRL